MDKSAANKAVIDAINADREPPMVTRPMKYLNNSVEQDHRCGERLRAAIGPNPAACPVQRQAMGTRWPLTVNPLRAAPTRAGSI